MNPAEWLILLCFWAGSITVLILLAFAATQWMKSCTGRFHSMIWSAVLFTALLVPIAPFVTPPLFDLSSQTAYSPLSAFFIWLGLAVWAAGVMFNLLKQCYAWYRITSLCRQAESIEAERINKLVEHTRMLLFLDQSIPVKTAEWVSAPFIKGLWIQTLYVPPFLLTDSTNQTRLAVIAHELAHISRYDLIFHHFMNVICVLFWFLPPVWWMRKRLYEEQDRACDECASVLVGNNLRFAEAIKNYAANTLHQKQLSCGLGFSHSQPAIYSRLESILEKETHQLTRLPLVSKIVLVLPFFIIMVCSSWVSHLVFPLEVLQHNLFFNYLNHNDENPQMLLVDRETDSRGMTTIATKFSHPMHIPGFSDMSVYGSMSGKIAGKFLRGFNGSLLFTTNHSFYPGEKINAVFTNRMHSIFGYPLNKSVVWEYIVSTTGGTGRLSEMFETFDGKTADTESVVVGDLDLDGDLDIVTANKENNNAICMNDGNGNYEEFYISNEEFITQEIVLADFDNDGYLDIAEANAHNQPNYVYYNDGYGRFPRREMFGNGSDWTTALAAGDLNGDGFIDLVVGKYHIAEQHYYLNNGDGTFSPPIKFADVSGISSIVIADFDNDRDLDIATGTNEWENNDIHYNDGTANFNEKQRDFTSDGLQSMKAGDLNNDGYPDLVARIVPFDKDTVEEQIRIFINDTEGKLTERSSIRWEKNYPEKEGQDIALGDMNGDGYLDIVLAARHHQHMVYLNNKTGLFTQSGLFLPFGSNDDYPYSIALGDVNGDGALDVAIGGYSTPNKVYLNQN